MNYFRLKARSYQQFTKSLVKFLHVFMEFNPLARFKQEKLNLVNFCACKICAVVDSEIESTYACSKVQGIYFCIRVICP